MARKALIAKAARLQRTHKRALKDGRKPKFPTKVYNRCCICWRSRGYIGKFDMCRICVRIRANAGEIPGLRKSSW